MADQSSTLKVAELYNNIEFSLFPNRWGQQFQQYARYSRPKNAFDYSGYYNISNLDNTFISSGISYQTDLNGTSASIVFDRPFYSPLARWAGGAQATKAWRPYNYLDPVELIYKDMSLDNFYYDIWAAKNIK